MSNHFVHLYRNANSMRKEMELNEKRPKEQQKTREEIETEYRYKEPRSSSRESAVVHLADSVEAASVSNKDKLLTSEDRQHLIENIVNAKIADHQLDDSGISYGDIEKIKAAFLKELNDKNYSRIKYQSDPAPVPDTGDESEKEQTVKAPSDSGSVSDEKNSRTEESSDKTEKKETAKKSVKTVRSEKRTAETDDGLKSKRTARKTARTKISSETED